MAHSRTFIPRSIGKIIQLDYDFIVPLEGECTVCLTNQHIQMILGMSDYFGWSTRWYSESGEVVPDVIVDLQGDLVRRIMMACCGEETRYRYTEDGQLETSEDDGLTWQLNPDADARINPPVIFPVLDHGEDDPECDAANAVVSIIKDQQQEQYQIKVDGGTAARIISAVTVLLVMLGIITGGLTAALAVFTTAIAAIMFGVTAEDFNDAFTETVWHDFLCIIRCNISAEGVVTESGWSAIKTDIQVGITGIAGDWLYSIVNAIGSGGLTNAANSGFNADESCEECDCGEGWCYYWDFTVDDYGWSGGWGTYVPTCCWEGVDVGGGNISLYKL